MRQKRTSVVGKRAQRRQPEQACEKTSDAKPSTITDTASDHDLVMVSRIKSLYLLAHPTQSSISVEDAVEYFTTSTSPYDELPTSPPSCGERILLLVLRTKEERANIPGDLEEEFKQIAAKHGTRYAKLWYYKQVAASAWPMVRKAIPWGLLASAGAWLRGRI